MENDFYLDARWLAGYFEKDWADYFDEQSIRLSEVSEYPPFESKYLYSSYHQEFADFLVSSLCSERIKPARMMEVGSSLGRTYFEVCKRFDTLKEAILIEPSKNLAETFVRLFESNGLSKFSILRGNRNLAEVMFDSSKFKKSCSHVNYDLINLPYESVQREIAPLDLVICSNVIDQCQDPEKLVEFLQSKVKRSGVLAISCTYQWNDKYIEKKNQTITDIKSLFGREWKMLGETNIEFKCRKNERHWVSFLSHAVSFQNMD